MINTLLHIDKSHKICYHIANFKGDIIMKKNLLFIFILFISFFCSTSIVNADTYQIPTFIKAEKISATTARLTFKTNSSCKNCGIMLYEDVTDKIVRLPNNATSFVFRNLNSKKVYKFLVSEYYIDKYGVYKNIKLSKPKYVYMNGKAPSQTVSCSFEKINNSFIGKNKSKNIYFNCSTKNSETIKSIDKGKVTLVGGKYGNISKPTLVSKKNIGGGYKYRYKVTYLSTKKSNVIYASTIKVSSGFAITNLGNKNIVAVSKPIKTDTKKPTLDYSTNKQKMSNGKYSVSKNDPLRVTFKCFDSYSGVKSIKINTKTYTGDKKRAYTITKSHNPIKYKVTCNDKAGNSYTKTYSFKTTTK